ncbi:MAG: FAD-dependent oxidoreductase [Lentisphaerae bacterium]|nr:FAD-dependent oxidoreductase [Lentisphaerota bacterium]
MTFPVFVKYIMYRCDEDATGNIMTSFNYNLNQKIETVRQCQVVVAGAGPAGICAALTAAQMGCDTVLIERHSMPGGMAYAGEVSPFMLNHLDEESMDHPLYADWLSRMGKYHSAATLNYIDDKMGPKWGKLYINKYYAALSAEDMLNAAGVKVLYEHTLFDTVKENGQIKTLILHNRSGLTAVSGEVYIDATGDGVLAAQAGCKIEIGNDEGLCQPMTWCFKVAPVRIPDEDFWCGEWRKKIQQEYSKAKAAGDLSCPRENILMFQSTTPDTVHFNTTRVVLHDPLDSGSYQEAGMIAREQIREFLFWLRNRIEGFENAEIVSMGQQLGIRESRRVIGKFCLTADDLYRRRKFPDAIARCNYPVDIHSPSGSGTTYTAAADYSDYYEIPFRCLIPQGCDNLLTAGRIISSDHITNSSLRIMPVCCATGQGAGAGAALAVKNGLLPGQVNGIQVRTELIDFGAFLGASKL